MKLVIRKLGYWVLLLGIIAACNNDAEVVPVDVQIKRFVWSGMNLFYYWQAEVPELSDDNNSSGAVLNDFLSNYHTPEDLFKDLKHPDDRFSWMVNDYEALEQSFQGVSQYGFDVGLVRIEKGSDDLLAYIRYVLPGTPAENVGLKRGDIFIEVNGQKLTLDNYSSLLFSGGRITITLAAFQDNALVSTDRDIAISEIQISENPILLSDVFDVEGIKVGYLVYNQFVNNNTYHEELNDVFGGYKNEGINELVLDLRYNGGGSLETSRILSSLIYGAADSLDVLGSIIYNQRFSDFNADITFMEEIPVRNSNGVQTSSMAMNRLNLNRLFVLTSGSSASASEFVIAGLSPYMEVTIVGDTTVGKNVASITVYDSENYEKSSTLNLSHKYAIQPIISQLANSVGFTDYVDGLIPDVHVNEVNFLTDLKPLGDPEEAILSEVLAIISGSGRRSISSGNGMLDIKDSRLKDVANTVIIDDPTIRRSIKNQMLGAYQ